MSGLEMKSLTSGFRDLENCSVEAVTGSPDYRLSKPSITNRQWDATHWVQPPVYLLTAIFHGTQERLKLPK